VSLPQPAGRLLPDGHVEWTHTCQGREVVATLPMPPWRVLGDRVDPSVHCTACGMHGVVQIEATCCDIHGPKCEPPSELCCRRCPEAGHPWHPPGVECVLPGGVS
jgi:hypothetical protein